MITGLKCKVTKAIGYEGWEVWVFDPPPLGVAFGGGIVREAVLKTEAEAKEFVVSGGGILVEEWSF